MKKLIILFMLAFMPVQSFACDNIEDTYVIYTPKGKLFAQNLKYFPETHEWMVDASNEIDGKLFQVILPCKWVKIYDMDGEVTEEKFKVEFWGE